MVETRLAAPELNPWELVATGPSTLARAIYEEEVRVASGPVNRLRPLPTGYEPPDDLPSTGLRTGDVVGECPVDENVVLA